MISWLSLNEVSAFVKMHSLGPETFKLKWMRRLFNLIPNNHFSGGRAVYISPCRKKGIVTVPYNYRNVSALGFMFGGSMYSGIDSMGVSIIFLHVDIRKYLITDTKGSIRHIKPGKKRLFAIISMTDEQEEELHTKLEKEGECELHFDIDIVELSGKVIAQATKSVLVRKRRKK